MTNRWQVLKRFAPALLGLLLFGLSLWTIHQELHRYGWQNVLTSLQSIPRKHLLGASLLMVINYIFLTAYDTLAMTYVGESLPYLKTGFVGFVSYAISNSVGLALLSSSAIRYRFYSQWGLSNRKIASIIAFCNLSFWLGLLTVGGITFLIDPLQLPPFLRLPFASAHPLGFIFLTLTLAYLWLSLLSRQSLQIGKWRLPHVPLYLSLWQIIITAIDWGLAAAILYILLPSHSSLSYSGFFGIYLLAQIVGLISNVPGGLGIFETVILLSLTPLFPPVQLLGALLAYRVIYFWIPLLLATLSLGFYEGFRQVQAKLHS